MIAHDRAVGGAARAAVLVPSQAMSSAGYQVAIAAVEDRRVSLLVSTDGRGAPRARRFPFLVVCEAFQVQHGLCPSLPAGWWVPPHVDVGARATEHGYAHVLGRYRLDRGWGDDEREDDFQDDRLIAAVSVRDDGAHAVIELEVVDGELLRHLIPGARWAIGWW